MRLADLDQPFVVVVQRIDLAVKKKNLPDVIFIGGNSGRVGSALVLPISLVRVEVYCGRESLENVINSKAFLPN